jgi:hypothetical protein
VPRSVSGKSGVWQGQHGNSKNIEVGISRRALVAHVDLHLVRRDAPVSRPDVTAAGCEKAVQYGIALARQFLDLRTFESVGLVLTGYLGVAEVTSFVGHIKPRFTRPYLAEWVDQMNVALGVEQALAAQQVDLIRGQDAFALRNDGVAADDKGVGLVIVDEILAGDIDRPLMLSADVRGEARVLCARRKRYEPQRTGRDDTPPG